MTYNDVFFRKRILDNIPLCYEGRQLPKSMKVAVVMMKVAYDKEGQTYEEEMKEVLKSLKKEGFDERSQAYASMEDVYKKVKDAEEWEEGLLDEKGEAIIKPTAPSKEEIETADKAKATEEDFLKERDELYSDYNEARIKKGEEKSSMTDRKFTTDQFSDIVEMIGIEGDIELSGFSSEKINMGREQFITFIGSDLVEL